MYYFQKIHFFLKKGKETRKREQKEESLIKKSLTTNYITQKC